MKTQDNHLNVLFQYNKLKDHIILNREAIFAFVKDNLEIKMHGVLTFLIGRLTNVL